MREHQGPAHGSEPAYNRSREGLLTPEPKNQLPFTRHSSTPTTALVQGGGGFSWTDSAIGAAALRARETRGVVAAHKPLRERITMRTTFVFVAAAASAAVLVGFAQSAGAMHAGGNARRVSGITHATAGVTRIRLRVLGSLSVPVDGAPLQFAGGAGWSASSSGLVRLSFPTGAPHIVVHEPIDDVALGNGEVYALSAAKSQVVEVAPRTSRVIKRWRVLAGAHSIVATRLALYVAAMNSKVQVERIDFATGRIMSRTLAAQGLALHRAIAVSASAVWVTDSSQLFRLDPVDLTVKRVSATPAVDGVWAGDGYLWIASETPNAGVFRVDPKTDRVLGRSGPDAIQVAFAAGVAWLSSAQGPTAINPANGRQIASIRWEQLISRGAAGIAVAGNQIWVTYADIGKLQRLAVE
jgi:hypothetical protein